MRAWGESVAAGLDSTTAMHVLEILQRLAQGGRCVVTTIHQPSSRLYATLDKLLLLSKVRACLLSAPSATFWQPPQPPAALGFCLLMCTGAFAMVLADSACWSIETVFMPKLLIRRRLPRMSPPEESGGVLRQSLQRYLQYLQGKTCCGSTAMMVVTTQAPIASIYIECAQMCARRATRCTTGARSWRTSSSPV